MSTISKAWELEIRPLCISSDEDMGVGGREMGEMGVELERNGRLRALAAMR